MIACHFADDTCLTYARGKMKTLETDLNYDSNILKNGLMLIDFP